MARYVVLSGSIVANVVVAEGDAPGLVRSDTANIGDSYDAETGAFAPPGVPLATLQAEVSTRVMAMRDTRIDGGFAFRGVRYQTRQQDRENIAGAAQLAFMAIVADATEGDLRWSDPDSDFVWIAEDNEVVGMDAQTTVAFGKAAAAYKQACIFAAFGLKTAIEAAKAPAALAAIDLDAGWPG